MTNFYYISGALGAPALLKMHHESVQKLLSGTYCSSDLEMLKGHHGVYSFRLNKDQRLIFTTIEINKTHHLLLLDYLPTHDYHKCRYLKPQILKQYISKQQASADMAVDERLTFEAIQDQELLDDGLKRCLRDHRDSRKEITSQPVYYYKSQLVVLNPMQTFSLSLSLPAIVSGVAGSGKSCVALAALTKAALNRGAAKPIWYVTQSRLLVEEMKAQWAMRMDEDIHPVELMTYHELLQRQVGGLLGEFVDEQAFTGWYHHYLEHQKKVLRTQATAAVNYPDSRRAYQEFRICSAYTKMSYCALGARQSRIDKSDRPALYDAYMAYQAYLLDKKQVNAAFYDFAVGDDALCSLIVVDEAQDFSTLALTKLHDIAASQVLYCMDSHQRVEDDMSIGPFLKERFAISDRCCVDLVATYRCPLKVVSAANEVIRLKHVLSGGKIDKDELPRVSGMGGDEKSIGALFRLDEKTLCSEDSFIKKLAQTTQLAVITIPERVEELKKTLGTSLVFTAKTIKGLEYDVVVTVGLYDKTFFKAAYRRQQYVGDDAPVNRAKEGKADPRFVTILNQIYVAYTRAKKTLVICEEPTQYTNILLSQFEPMLNQGILFEEISAGAADENSWLEQIKLQVRVGNDALAKEIYLSKINSAPEAFEHWLMGFNSPCMPAAVAAATAQANPVRVEDPVQERNAPASDIFKVSEEKIRLKRQSLSKTLETSSMPSLKKSTEAQKLYEAFEAERLLVTLSRVDVKALLFEGSITQDAGSNIALIDFIEKNDSAKQIFIGCVANDLKILKKLTPILLDKKYKERAFVQWLLPLAKEFNAFEKSIVATKDLAWANGLIDVGTPAYIAVYDDQITKERLQCFKEHGVDLDKFDKEGETPFCVAVYRKNLAAIRVLKELGANINKPNQEGETPLYKAAYRGTLDVIRVLIELGADINQPNQHGVTPFHVAAHCKHLDAIITLKELGADSNQPDKSGATPLFTTACNGDLEIIRLLIKLGANIHQSTQFGLTPLHTAAYNGYLNVIKKFIKFGANIKQPDSEGATPVYLAARGGHSQAIRILKESGADINQSNQEGNTPLYAAANLGHLNAIQLLIKMGAYIDQANIKGETPLYVAAYRGHLDAIRMLIKLGANIKQPNLNGETPLYAAACSGHSKIIRILKELGADINQPSQDGMTPIHEAAYSGHLKAMRMLKTLGADVNQPDKRGATPIYAAACEGHLEMIRELIKLGANINQSNHQGATPLYVAAYNGDLKTIRTLIEFGADINQPNRQGITPLGVADYYGHHEVTKLLTELGAHVSHTDQNSQELIPPMTRGLFFQAAKTVSVEMDQNLTPREGEKKFLP